jgi:uncharacterized protein YjbJ (UPF0337 family)
VRPLSPGYAGAEAQGFTPVPGTRAGRLESAYGELTGDTGHQIQGKAKQVQGSAMNVAEDLKAGARSAAKNVADAADRLADNLS